MHSTPNNDKQASNFLLKAQLIKILNKIKYRNVILYKHLILKNFTKKLYNPL